MRTEGGGGGGGGSVGQAGGGGVEVAVVVMQRRLRLPLLLVVWLKMSSTRWRCYYHLEVFRRSEKKLSCWWVVVSTRPRSSRLHTQNKNRQMKSRYWRAHRDWRAHREDGKNVVQVTPAQMCFSCLCYYRRKQATEGGDSVAVQPQFIQRCY